MVMPVLTIIALVLLGMIWRRLGNLAQLVQLASTEDYTIRQCSGQVFALLLTIRTMLDQQEGARNEITNTLRELVELTAAIQQDQTSRASNLALLMETRGAGRQMLRERIAERVKQARRAQ